MSEVFKPTTAEQLRDTVAWATAEEIKLEVLGSASKRGFGRPLALEHRLELAGLAGILFYEPEELVLSARVGTPLAEVKAALAARKQELAFEPLDLAPLYGGAAGAGTIGGTVACNLAGSRRIKAGAARDHLLGFKAVSGRGEAFKSGGRVVKNVTGYDLSKIMAGSHGTLGVMSEVTLKVLPVAEKARTVLLYGLDDATAVEALSRALGSPHEVSAAAHLPAAVAAESGVSRVAAAGAAVTAIRVEGPGPSVEPRCAALRAELGVLGETEELHSHNSRSLWREITDLKPFVARPELALWRVSVAPTAGPAIMAKVAPTLSALHYYDWGGGLVWLGVPADGDAGAAVVRAAVAPFGGHATLVRAPDPLREHVAVFQPLEPAKLALSRRLKEGFDPHGILNPGRMYPDV
jgi:glycolate oxidase FAD binding subunit